MQARTKQKNRGGRPRKFDEGEALGRMRRQLWTTGLSGTSIEEIARSAGLNRPSLAAAFGDKDAIYAKAAAQYGRMMDHRMRDAMADEDLATALMNVFATAIDIYTESGPNGCFITSTAPAETLTSSVVRDILDRTLHDIDALFLERLEKEKGRGPADLPLLAAQLGATLHSLSLRARAGWTRDKLHSLAEGTIRSVLAFYGNPDRRSSEASAP
jgi:AcrR family transcriptional regulator